MFLVIQIGLNKQEEEKSEEGKFAGAQVHTNTASVGSKRLLPEQWHQPDDEKVAIDSTVPLLQEIV